MKREFMLMLLSILCSISSMAQTDSYYYYRGTKIPLTLNEDKICVSIAKEHDMVSERIRANVQVLRTIENNAIDLFVISRSDFENLTSQEFWVEDAKSVILSSCYFTENYEEVATSPYLTVKLKNEEDQDLLTSYAEQYKLRIVGNDPYLPLWYILSLTPESEKSPLECANELWESEEFAASLPDFVPLSDDETAIPNVATTPTKVSSDIYDLQGRHLTSQPSNACHTSIFRLKKGVFIKDGKKVVVK